MSEYTRAMLQDMPDIGDDYTVIALWFEENREDLRKALEQAEANDRYIKALEGGE